MAMYGEMLKERRKTLRLGLREFALRAGMDAGNLSKIERGKASPPQTGEVLDRIASALELDPDEERAVAMRDRAFVDNGRIPEELLSDEEIMARLPVLLRTVKNQRLDSEQIDRLIQMLREA